MSDALLALRADISDCILTLKRGGSLNRENMRDVLERARDSLAERIPRERDAERLRHFVDNNMTFMDVDHDKPIDGVPNVPVLASVSRRVWYHVTDDQTSYPFSAVIDAAIAGDSHDG